MKIVVTNDDGFDQPGLKTLIASVQSLGEITVVAPATPQSNVGHRVTMREPIPVKRTGERFYVVHGTPADCTRLAIKKFVPDVNWVIAGINPGANLGSDVYQSGTVAAAREAAILGVRSVAVSQYISPEWVIDWPTVQHHVEPCIAKLVHQRLSIGDFWNINLPSPITVGDVLAHRFCPLDKHPHLYDFVEKQGVYHYDGIIHDRPRTDGSDVDVCFGGMVSITRMEM